MNTVLAPVYLSALAGGWIANAFGYPILFASGCRSPINILTAIGVLF